MFIIYIGYSKGFKPHSERAMTECFGCGITLPFIKLKKQIHIAVSISVQVRPMQRGKVCNKYKICEV